jgi:hypothetical protein
VWHSASEQGFGRWVQHGATSCLGALVSGSPVAQPADHGIRSTDRTNRHGSAPRGSSVDHYRLEIPLTWIIVYDNQTYVGSRLVRSDTWIVATKGIGRAGLGAYWHKEEPVSEITFYFAPHDSPDAWFPEHAKVLSTQELLLGNETLICWGIIPYPDTRPKPIDPAFAEIICLGRSALKSNSVSTTEMNSAKCYEMNFGKQKTFSEMYLRSAISG